MRIIVLLAILFLTACETNPPAPVIDRAPSSTKPAPPKPGVKPTQNGSAKDWRPSTHTVVKGDTLYAIGLQYGLDYKELAQLNQLSAPYAIQIGQVLLIKDKNAQTGNGTEANPDGVVITPIQTDTGVTGTAPSQVTPILSAPKATKEVYSDAAYTKASLPSAKPEDAPTTPAKPSTDGTSDEQIAWSLPTTGKITAHFNESNNKGIDFDGKLGQAVNAAAAGKVIYAGSDLRGYGKLVIIKHNKTYLSVYAHNSKLLVKEGQTITMGQKIAEMGNTDTDKVKLHFEIRKQGKSVDPEKYLPKN